MWNFSIFREVRGTSQGNLGVFYINVAVEFDGIEIKNKTLWFNRAHAMGRIEELASEADAEYGNLAVEIFDCVG